MMDEHTIDNPYCGDLSCWCHNNDAYHATFTDNQLSLETDGQTFDMALTLLGDHSYEPEYS